MPPTITTILLLTLSNVFMTFAWYGHLKNLSALSVFIPFVMLYMREKLTLDYLWAALCIVGAAYFIFRRG